VVWVSDFKIASKFFLWVELEFGNFVVLFSQFKGNLKVRSENFILSIFVVELVLKVFHVADTVFVPLILPERIIVVDTPLRPVSIKFWFEIRDDIHIEVVVVFTERIRFPAHKDTAEILWVIRRPEPMDSESFSRL
jgi:hypothetical protein